MSCRMSHRVAARVLTGLMVVGLAGASSVAADKDKKKAPKQGDAARAALDKQKEIARGLKEKASSDPAALQKQLDELKAELQAEKDRQALALEPLNKELKASTAANDRRRASRTQKAIDKANESHKAYTERLEKQIADLQARLDAGKPK